MTLLPALWFFLWGEPCRCMWEAGGFEPKGDIRHFAVTRNSVYVATEEKLYQLSQDLRLVHSLSLRGILTSKERVEDERFIRVSGADEGNATFRVNVLLPFVENNTLISCGVTDVGCGYCEVLDLRDVSNVLHSEYFQVGPPWPSNSSVAFLVKLRDTRVETYILSASQQLNRPTNCSHSSSAVDLHNTNNNQPGLIFSSSGEYVNNPIKRKGDIDVEFVDGFQVDSIIYLFSNLPSGDNSNKVRLIWLEDKSKKIETLGSLRGATLSVSDGAKGSRLLASSLIPGGPPVMWSGVFSVDVEGMNTQLVMFDISPDLTRAMDADPDFCTLRCNPKGGELSKMLKPKKVIYRQNYMTSVLAVKQKAWIVFFIGTGDGQLIQLAVDKNYQTACPKVLYRANDDRRVFRRIHMDQVAGKHIYVPFLKQIKRVAVANCSKYKNVGDCWSAQDPYCVWCSSKSSCTFEDDCPDSQWLSISEEHHQKMVSYEVIKDSTDQVKLTIQIHMTVGEKMSNFACQFSTTFSQLYNTDKIPPQFPQCTCTLPNGTLSVEGLNVMIKIRLGTTDLFEKLEIFNCTDIRGPLTFVLCKQCIDAGCGWSKNGCSWANQGKRNVSDCQRLKSGMNYSMPEISSISPNIVSFYGKNNALLLGRNLSSVTRVRIEPEMDCKAKESPVWRNNGVSLMFHIPSTNIKGRVRVCVLLPDGSCHGNVTITYRSSPSCTNIIPNSTWISGKREITLIGSHLDFVEGIMHSHALQEVRPPKIKRYKNLTYDTPAAESTGIFKSGVLLKVANDTLPTSATITYYPNPEFTSFTTTRTGDKVKVTIEKKADKLEMTLTDLSVWGIHEEKEYQCIMETKGTSNETEFFICEIQMVDDYDFQKLKIKYGNEMITLTINHDQLLLILLVLLLIPFIIILVVIVYRSKQKKLTAEMNKSMVELERIIRNDIRQGFVDLQTEKTDLMENAGTIPFLAYKHFASRLFFPESESLRTSCIKDFGQDVVQVQLDKCSQALSRLLQKPLFLKSMVLAMEEQKSFNVKDKCMLASLLTVALHSNLPYLTQVMEDLLSHLMQKNSNTQAKLLLRRTESIVEKLLTNWMSICLSGFLRERIGPQLFLVVSALTQQIAKGPVDRVTEKALYTLSEDWLLWQAQDFSSLRLNVLFEVGSDGEVSEPLEVSALNCDTVEQVKEKIQATFKAKFGFPYSNPLMELCVEYEKNRSLVLQEVDTSSDIIGEVTMLNTLRHYKVSDGATIKVLSQKTSSLHLPLTPQGSLKDDKDFSGKYFHLIDPDVVEDQKKNPERKKFKLKEVHLTKLLSTKVAVHPYVENLFRSIWGMTHSKVPPAVKYFFDFLDRQADNMKITDPDVLHIWKTNSLPLRFWVNIIKNPQFVFDMEKTPNMDGCLSVIAQAFMDSFSLSDTQLGKHAPTNKLLYARDIPKFKQEVKIYYKQIREQTSITVSEFKAFLQEESKKHENEFNEAVALRELYKFINRYFTEIKEKLYQNEAPSDLTEDLQHVKTLFDGLKSCSWN